MSAALRELDDLKKLLETQTAHLGTSRRRPSTAFSSPRSSAVRDSSVLGRSVDGGVNGYTSMLSHTEENVERLNKAMEAAEEEMEAAFRRAGDIHRVQVQRRETESAELKRLLQAKEEALESMKDTVTHAKRTLESKLAQTESALAQRDAEMLGLQDENRRLRGEVRTLKDELEKEATSVQFATDTLSRRDAEMHSKLRELNDTVKELSEAKSRIASKLQTEVLEKEALQKRLQTFQAEMDSMKMEIAAERDSSRTEMSTLKEKVRVEEEIRREYQQRYESEKAKRKLSSVGKERESATLKELEKKLRSERRCRKASEKWLKAELNSREELETLFLALRDIALSKDKHSSDLGLDEIAALLEERRKRPTSPPGRYVSPDRRATHSAPATGRIRDAHYRDYYWDREAESPVRDALRQEFEISRRLLDEDNCRLKHELHEARRILTERLNSPPRRSRRL